MRLIDASQYPAPPAGRLPALCSMIESLGMADFPEQLLASLNRTLPVELLAVYAFGGAGTATRLAFGVCAGKGPEKDDLVRVNSRKYIELYAQDDPARSACEVAVQRGSAAARTVITTCVSRGELPHEGHRQLLEAAGVADRIALFIPPRGGGWHSPRPKG